MKTKEVVDAQREIIQGYYNWIFLDKPNTEQILDRLEIDLNYVRGEQIVLDAENIIKEKTEVSLVKCDTCQYQWVAVRPEGLLKLECPKCGNNCGFENQP